MKRKPDEMDVDHSEYFENKGIHCVGVDGEDERKLSRPNITGADFSCRLPKRMWYVISGAKIQPRTLSGAL